MEISEYFYLFQVAQALAANQKVVERLNDVGVRFAESRNKTFHCLTPDCPQWWFIEEEETSNLIFCHVNKIYYF